MKKVTESSSKYRHLEKMDTIELLTHINNEDKSVPLVIEQQIPTIERVVNMIVDHMLSGGRVFYLGSGTSGRLGVVDASELPPTFGVDDSMFIGLIAGGDKAIRKAQEFAEDDIEQGWKDIQQFNPTTSDIVIGIAASGSTPYVWGALKKAQENGLKTSCIVCNPGSKVAEFSTIPIEIIVGSEFVTGSTRMKAGTAQKLVLNMISTSVMIKLGRVKDNKMVDMQLSNKKLVDRGTKMVMAETGLNYEDAKELLLKFGSVREAINGIID